MMRRAIVHVGTPRTGTSTFQRVLYNHRAALLEAGILYPELKPRWVETPHLNHQHLGEALDGRRTAAEGREMLDHLEQQLQSTTADTVILSYERLCLASPRRNLPGLFHNLLTRTGFQLEVMATVRQPAEVLNSQYGWRTQFLREGRTFALFAQAWRGDRALDLPGLMLPWLKVAATFHAVPLHDATSGRPLVDRILGQLGLFPRLDVLVGAERSLPRENRSPGPVAVEVARRLRRGSARRATVPEARAATTLAGEQAAARGLDASSFHGLDPKILAEMEATWHRANDRFAGLVWGQPWSARVATEAGRALNELARIPHDPEAERHVQAILQACCDRFQITCPPGPPHPSPLDWRTLAEAERLARTARRLALSML